MSWLIYFSTGNQKKQRKKKKMMWQFLQIIQITQQVHLVRVTNGLLKFQMPNGLVTWHHHQLLVPLSLLVQAVGLLLMLQCLVLMAGKLWLPLYRKLKVFLQVAGNEYTSIG